MKAITTKFHGPANVRGSRYTASDSDDNRTTVGADDALSSEGNHDAAALALCKKMGWSGVLVRGGLKGSNVYVWLDDQELLLAPKGAKFMGIFASASLSRMIEGVTR